MEFIELCAAPNKGLVGNAQNEPVASKGEMRDVRASEEKLQRAHQSGSARQIDLFSAAAELIQCFSTLHLSPHSVYNYYDVLLIEK